MPLIGSTSAQMLLLMLLPLFIFHQSSAAPTTTSGPDPCRGWDKMHEFNINLKQIQDKVKNCPTDCSSAGQNAACQCLDLSEPLKQPSLFPGYFTTGLDQLKNRDSATFSNSNIMNNFIDQLETGCQCESVNKNLCSQDHETRHNHGSVSPKTLLEDLKLIMERYNTERSYKE